jgi:hypothetical protein
VAVNKLLAPLGLFVYAPNTTTGLSDSRENSALTRNYIVFYDEMAGFNKNRVEIIKNKISSDLVPYRILTTNFISNSPNNATFIGCSNLPLDSLIDDPTSVRRFWQINCLDQMDWEAINNINYKAVWQCVDIKEDYFTGRIEEFSKVQETLRNVDLTEEFYKDCLVNSESEADRINGNDLYRAFREWCKQEGHRSITRTAFGKKIKMCVNYIKSGCIKYECRIKTEEEYNGNCSIRDIRSAGGELNETISFITGVVDDDDDSWFDDDK